LRICSFGRDNPSSEEDLDVVRRLLVQPCFDLDRKGEERMRRGRRDSQFKEMLFHVKCIVLVVCMYVCTLRRVVSRASDEVFVVQITRLVKLQ